VIYFRNKNQQDALFYSQFISIINLYEGVLSPTRKETRYSDQTRDILNTLPTKLNALLSPLL